MGENIRLSVKGILSHKLRSFLTMLGIIVGIAGLAGCGANYPIYKKMLETGKAKYAYEIVELARQISEQ